MRPCIVPPVILIKSEQQKLYKKSLTATDILTEQLVLCQVMTYAGTVMTVCMCDQN